MHTRSTPTKSLKVKCSLVTPSKDDKKKEEEEAFNEKLYFEETAIKSGPSRMCDVFDNIIKSSIYNTDTYEKMYALVKEAEFMGYSSDQLLTIENANCNVVFAHFLLYMQNLVSSEFAKCLIVFVKYLRDCINKHGWDLISRMYIVTNEEKREEYCNKFNAEYLPDMCNLFINEYLPKYCPKYDEKLATDTALYLCNWLHKHKYTSSRLERNKL